MDFFEAQSLAKKRSKKLVFLFLLSVLSTIALIYAATILILNRAYWDPEVFFYVSSGTVLTIGVASIYKYMLYSSGGSAVAESIGARQIELTTNHAAERRLINVVEEMAIASGVPMPAVYVMENEPSINAFAAGLTLSDAAVCVTRGTMEKLTRDELQAVIGHEFSHILNGDMRLNLRIGSLVFGILAIGMIGRGVLRSLRGSSLSSRKKNSSGVVGVILAIGLALYIVGYIGYFFGRLIQAAVSRQREFLADAASVQFTRNPTGITGALKKIGGYALGSSLQSNKAAEFGHFFFAQGFTSDFASLWATHPPLPERIRAIEPAFDGKYFSPPEVVDIDRQTWSEATSSLATPVHRFNRPTPPPPNAHTIIASVGSLSAATIENAQALLEATPTILREAAHTPASASALLCGLLLDPSPELRARQQALIHQHGGPALAQAVTQLDSSLLTLGIEARLPLLFLSLRALRSLPPSQLPPFLATLDELVHADGRVNTFEFALQKVLSHHLELGQSPRKHGHEICSFEAMRVAIIVVLSCLARAAADDETSAQRAFAAGTNQLRLLEGDLQLLPTADCNFERLDAALDLLAQGSLPIKKRLLVAAAHVVTADGNVRISEIELLRAFASTLDCPMPSLAA